MKNDKFSIDILIIFGYVVFFLLMFADFYSCYADFFRQRGMDREFINEILIRFYRKFSYFQYSLFTRFFCLLIFSFGTLGFSVKKKPETKEQLKVYLSMFIVVTLIFIFVPIFGLGFIPNLVFTIVAFVMYVWSFLFLRRCFRYFGNEDEFNEKNQIFKQEQKVKNNRYSVNFKTNNGAINVINPFRATMVLGTPGSGKSYSVIEEYIRQHIKKKFTMLVYDFKFPALGNETYAFFEYYKKTYDVEPKFSVISLDDIEKSNFINPLSPNLIRKTADAIEASQTVLFNLNKEWIVKKDFFSLSAVSYFACCIYFLKIYEDGKFCTLPHAIALASCSDEKVFKVFSKYKELKFFLSPFQDALEKKAFEQLSGQTATARIPLSQLATKELFWVMGNNVFPELNVPLGINDPEHPTIMILANSPTTQSTNSPALGLISTQIIKEINTQGRQPCSVILDELPTMYFMGLDNLIATARSNKISTTIGMQDLEQLKRDYGDKVADTIFNIVGNIFSGAVRSGTASKLQEIFGKKKQKLKNVSVETQITSFSINESLEYAIPVSVISQLSQGEFVGIISDNFGEEVERKIFRGKIKVEKNRTDQIKKPLPKVIDEEDFDKLISGNFDRIVEEVDILIDNLLYADEENDEDQENSEDEENIENQDGEDGDTMS